MFRVGLCIIVCVYIYIYIYIYIFHLFIYLFIYILYIYIILYEELFTLCYFYYFLGAQNEQNTWLKIKS